MIDNLATRALISDIFFILIGVGFAAFGLEGLLLPNTFIDGGVTGICLLITESTGLSLPLLLLIVNIPFVLLAYRVVGRSFAIKSSAAIAGLAFALLLFDFPEITQDKLLVSVFGGFFLGTGIGLTMRGGSVLDGTEILAIFLSRRTSIKVSDWVILINVLIFGAAAYLLSIEQALYSMLTYFVASKALDFVIDGVEEYTGVLIVSANFSEIRQVLIEELGYGATMLNGQGGYKDAEETLGTTPVIYTVITRLEIRKLTLAVQHIDKRAFITMISVNDVYGGTMKRRKKVSK